MWRGSQGISEQFQTRGETRSRDLFEKSRRHGRHSLRRRRGGFDESGFVREEPKRSYAVLKVDEAQPVSNEISTIFKFSSDGFSPGELEESCARATEHAPRHVSNKTKAVSANFRAATNLFMPHSTEATCGSQI